MLKNQLYCEVMCQLTSQSVAEEVDCVILMDSLYYTLT